MAMAAPPPAPAGVTTAQGKARVGAPRFVFVSAQTANARVAYLLAMILVLPALAHQIGRAATRRVEAAAPLGNAGNATAMDDSAMGVLARAFSKPTEERLAELRVESDWKNRLILGLVCPASVDFEAWPRFLQSWARNFVAGLGLYLVVGSAWAATVYGPLKQRLFGSTPTPSGVDMAKQVWVSLQAMPMYTALPAVCEAIVESGNTLVFPRVDDVGVPAYVAFFWLYMTSVEFGVYWMHRSLHDVKLGYSALHKTHHIYNKEHTLSPFAGLAFHPLDGILQAIPYLWSLFFVPCHYLTHELLLFGTAIWTTNIHDCVYAGGEPIMGAGYHLLHHTNYRTNYGHYTIYFDKLFGTLQAPPASSSSP